METNQAKNVLQYSGHCRICLQINQQMTPIQSLKELIDFNMLLTFFNVEVMADIRYPNKICVVCLNQLRNIVLFKQQCESSFIYLKNILNDDEFQTGNLSDNDKSIKIEDHEENDFEHDNNTDEKCHEATGEIYHETVNNNVKTEEPGTPDTASYLCNKCKSASETCNCINNHIKSEDNAGESKENSNLSSKKKSKNRFKCQHCEKTFIKRSLQLRHEATHEKPFKCDRCEESFLSENLLTRHIRIHLGLKPFPCTECSRSFSRRCGLNFHRKVSHSDNPPPKQTCTKCGKVVTNLHNHMMYKHSAYKFECPYCAKKFAFRAHLKEHVNNFHENCDDSFKVLCTLCGKKFRRVADLNRHNKSNHSDERNYPCRYCEKRFKTSSDRYNHEKSHLNNRRFQCTYCPKAFTKNTVLINHIRTHTGEKPYSCSMCSKTFRQDGTLRNHTRLVHGLALIKKE